MTQTQQKIKHWSHWLMKFPGQALLDEELQHLKIMLNQETGRYALLIGVPNQLPLLAASAAQYRFMMGPLIQRLAAPEITSQVEVTFQELPALSGSLNLVLLPHILELVDNPRQLLAEACRIVKPPGCIAICGFNPYSAWGLRKWLFKERTAPWSSQFIPASTVIKWLQLADFEVIQHDRLCHRPPASSLKRYQNLAWLETLGKKCYPTLGGVYIILARAKVVPLTPIRLHWKQQLSGVKVSPGVSGHYISEHV